MSAIYWLIFLAVAAAAGFYLRRWYIHPSEMPEIQTASYAFQVLESVVSYADRKGLDPEKEPLPTNEMFTPYLKDWGLARRQRDDVVRYMVSHNLIQRHEPHNNLAYVISSKGRQELESADELQAAARAAALKLPPKESRGDEAKAEVARIVAAAIRVDGRPSSTGNSKGPSAEEIASEVEQAANVDDPAKLDRTLDRVVKILQGATYAQPFAREILRILGL